MTTPAEFTARVQKAIQNNMYNPAGTVKASEHYDAEGGHCDTDKVLCDLLIELGYKEGIDLYLSKRRWFA